MLNPFAQRSADISPFYVMELLRRANHLESLGRDIIHMEIGEPEFTTPPAIINSGIKRLESGDIKYTSAAGLPALRQKIADYYRSRYAVSVDKDRIFITPGASGAFLLALAATINPRDEILMADPCYPCNRNFITLFDGIPVPIPVDASSQYQLTPDLLNQHWTPSTKGVVIASPSNPTGTLIKPEDLQQCIEFVNQKKACFFSDEIYHGLVYGKATPTALAYSQQCFVINSFSKYFGMTGWRIGWLIVPEDYRDATEKLAQNIFIATSTLSQYAALAAFDESTHIVLENRRSEYAHRRDFLYNELIKLGFGIPVKPEGAFYIYANCEKFTHDSYQFALDLLEAEGVAITPGKDFGHYQANLYLRFAYTSNIDRIAIAIQRIKKFINR